MFLIIRKIYLSLFRTHVKISDCHQKHEDVIKRKPGKLTEFLNGLANLIKNEHDKKGYR